MRIRKGPDLTQERLLASAGKLLRSLLLGKVQV
jgi:hypothetical protein